jgi:hypothetical protein
MRKMDILIVLIAVSLCAMTVSFVRSQQVCYSAVTKACATVVSKCEANACVMDADQNVSCPTPQGQVLNQNTYNTVITVQPPQGSEGYQQNEQIACIITYNCLGGDGNCVRVLGVLVCQTDPNDSGTFDGLIYENNPVGSSCQPNEA